MIADEAWAESFRSGGDVPEDDGTYIDAQVLKDRE